jgi:hypothetical protein
LLCYHLGEFTHPHEVSITARTTVETGQATLSPDPLASQRTELIGQLVASQFAIEAALAGLITAGADAAVAGEMRSQLALLSELRQQIGSAAGAALTALRNDVTAAAGSASSIVQQARAAANAASMAASEKLMTAQEARHAIQAIGHDLFDRHVLDPYLQFRSEEDEKAYRKREEERRIAYERELAKNTEEGDRSAAEIIKTQLVDAKAHGANASPDFASLLSRTEAAATALHQPRQAAATPSTDRNPPPSIASRASVDDKDVDAITAALKATGIVITQVSHEPVHGVPERSRVAAAATTVIGG